MNRISIVATAAVLSLAALSAQAVTLYNNGPVATAQALSILTLPATTFGFGANSAAGNSVAEDFTIGAGQTWNVESIYFYGYQTGSTSFTFQSATWSVVSGNINSGAVVASGTTAVTSGGLAGYRVTSNAVSDRSRGIYNAVADVSDFSLGAGTYWLRWSLAGSLASGPWVPPTSDAAIGNAQQALGGGAFSQLVEAGSGLSVSLPFTLNGTVTVVPEPSSVAMMLAGVAALVGVARRRRPSR